jgi:predicted dehydrogenase
VTAARRVGVLGLGSIGRRHLRNAVAVGAEAIAFDPVAEPGLEIDGRRIVLASSVEALMSMRPDGLVIASPSAQHGDQLALAVANRIPCLVEKPLATRGEGIADILTQADAQGLPVCAAFNLRFHSVVEAVAAHLAKGAVGTPTHAEFVFSDWMPGWRPGRDYRTLYAADPATGGVLLDDIHEFDLAVHLLGAAEVAASVAGRSGVLDMASEDRADVILTHSCGAQSVLHLDYCSRGRRRAFTIAGDQGRLSADLDARCLTIDAADGGRETRHFDGGYDDDYRREMEDFLSTLDGARPRCDGWEALAVLRLVLDARQLAGLAPDGRGRT